ncbi:ABC transporter substrate-binding protein [Paenibacillus yanchengensis]|uniref:ABC transporter substrate-binding protein n=1 Tax=Paenibacillus yanchengensis TaxID=2035833 RepID=A0ABW4YF41_9BACL
MVFICTSLMMLFLVMAGCSGAKQVTEGEKESSNELIDVKMMIDWTPNTNHTGIFVALENGFYKKHGLNVTIINPGDIPPEQVVAAGTVEFGIGNQENVTQARIQDVPLVSLAAIIQHNTSGFAAPASKNIKSPKDFAGKVYGSYGGEPERAIIKTLMEEEGADVEQVKFVNVGTTEFFAAVEKDIDFLWVFYAWTGIEAELRNEPIDMIYVNEFSDKLDYYTPVIVTNEQMINEQADVVKAFMAATSEGYEFAIDNPEEAAKVLLKAAPELDEELVIASQKWLSPRYKEDAPRWGEQRREVWQLYGEWMYDNGLIEKQLEVDQAYTNEFLPK